MPRASDEIYHSKVAAQMLHGGGSRWNSGNRWFDKTLQVCDEHTHQWCAALSLRHILMPCQWPTIHPYWDTKWAKQFDSAQCRSSWWDMNSESLQCSMVTLPSFFNARRKGAWIGFYFEFPFVLWQESQEHLFLYYIYKIIIIIFINIATIWHHLIIRYKYIRFFLLMQIYKLCFPSSSQFVSDCIWHTFCIYI